MKRNTKFKILNPKQTNTQNPNFKTVWDIEIWNLFGIWHLGFGALIS